MVTPFLGVWIEIFNRSSTHPGICVTPFLGVWIEIGPSSKTGSHPGVTPFVGVRKMEENGYLPQK